MITNSRLLVLLAIVVLSNGQSKNKRGCPRNDPDFNKCVVNKMNDLKPLLKKGIPELKILPVDPLKVAKISLKQGSGPVSINFTGTDQIFKGISNYRISSARVDLPGNRMEFSVSLPWLFVEGQTELAGRVLVLPLAGKGYSWTNYTTVSGRAVLRGHTSQKNRKEYFTLDDVDFDMAVKGADLHMNNLFKGNPELSEAVNRVMSENWPIVFQELKPVVDQTVEALIKDIAVKVFKGYALEDMFPA